MPEHETATRSNIFGDWWATCTCHQWLGPGHPGDVYAALRDRYDHLIATGIYELPEGTNELA